MAILLFIFFLTISVSSLDGISNGGFEIELIHRDSPLSPLYNHSATPGERSRQSVLRSLTRLNHIHRLFAPSNHLIASPVHQQQGGTYLIKFSIGTPPIPTFGIIDTGSDLVWTQCAPCIDCYNQKTPIFNSQMSSTYDGLSCQSAACGAFLNRPPCTFANEECEYSYDYADQSNSKGVLATETFIFDTAQVTNIVFGCGRNNHVLLPGDGSGLIGLGGGSLSLISQLGSKFKMAKFSYCFPAEDSWSKITFGKNPFFPRDKVVSTPLMINEVTATYYFVTLEGITIGDEKIANEFTVGKGNIFIDSGTTLTYLPQKLYYDVRSAMMKIIGLEATEDPLQPFSLCYATKNFHNVSDQKLVIHFTGADVILRSANLFMVLDYELTCLAMAPNLLDHLSVFGNLAQRNFQILFDLKHRLVSFAPADCTRNLQAGAGGRIQVYFVLPSFIFVSLIVLLF